METKLLDHAAVHQYRQDGWVLLGPVLNPSEIESLRAEERRFRLDVGYGAADNQNLRVNIQLCNRSAPIRAFCTAGPHLPLLQQLVGPNLCLTHQQFVTKLPDADGEYSDIPMHQDDGYGRLDPMTDITVWVPLVDVDRNNGALCVVSGSYRSGLLEHQRARVNPVLMETAIASGERVTVDMRAGEGIAFSGLTLHGSSRNDSAFERPAFYVRYCEPHTRMIDDGERRVLDDPHSWMVAGQSD